MNCRVIVRIMSELAMMHTVQFSGECLVLTYNCDIICGKILNFKKSKLF